MKKKPGFGNEVGVGYPDPPGGTREFSPQVGVENPFSLQRIVQPERRIGVNGVANPVFSVCIPGPVVSDFQIGKTAPFQSNGNIAPTFAPFLPGQMTSADVVAPDPRYLVVDDADFAMVSAIQFRASGGDGSFDDGNEQIVTPGFLGFADDSNSRIVVARFVETLPDDQYAIEVAGFDDTDPLAPIVGLRNID